jgi:anti-sigma factor RsiW
VRRADRRADRPAAAFWRWIAIAAAVLLAASAAWNIALLRSRTSSADLIAQDVLSSHVRSLMGTHLLDVPSSDQHTVKPWFGGKLDFSPDVRDFAAQGFPLIGGRIDYVGGRPAAVLVYQRRKHIINVFTWPSTATDGRPELDRNGYHVVHWNISGMSWWAVSDLNLDELRQFENLFRPPVQP